MAAPPNQTAATATVIPSIPYTVTMDVADQTASLQMWWRYTSVTSATVLGFLAFADLMSLYAPKITVYVGPDSASLTAYPIGAGIAASQKQIFFPVTGGDTYWLKVEQTGAGTPLGASLIFSAYAGPMTTPTVGSILVNDTDTGYPAATFSPSTGATETFLPGLAIGDMAVVLPGGAYALENFNPGFVAPSTVNLYTAGSVLVTTVTVTGNLYALAADHGTTFFIASSSTAFPADGAATVTTISSTGVVGGTTWTLPANSAGMDQMGVNSARTILYYAKFGNNEPIHRYNLAVPGALSDLVAGVANHSLVQDLLILADDTIIAAYGKDTVTKDYFIRKYSTAGATTWELALGTAPKVDRMALAVDDPVSFWARLLPTTATSTSLFRHLLASDGSTIHSTSTLDSFANGRSVLGYTGYPAGDPPEFGPSATCPFLLLRSAPSPAPTPSLTYRTDPIRRVRQAPTLWDNESADRIFYSSFELIYEGGVPTEDGRPLFFELQWSDDLGHRWSNLHRIEASSVGQYNFRAIWRRLGSARNRIFRIIDSNQAKIVILDAILSPTPEQGTS